MGGSMSTLRGTQPLAGVARPQLHPEQSIDAIVVHHPEAKCFSV
jgi:hypothetical protein